MKIGKLTELITAGTVVLVGPLMEWHAEDSAKNGAMVKHGVLVGKHVIEFTSWCPDKTTKAADIKRPSYCQRPGTTVVVVRPNLRMDGKYLRAEFESIEPIET